VYLLFVGLCKLLLWLFSELFELLDRLPDPTAFVCCAAFGGGAGWLSIRLLPHRIFPLSTFHGISLVVAPVSTGLVMALVGHILQRRNFEVTRLESFACGFAFALGLGLTRFLLAR